MTGHDDNISFLTCSEAICLASPLEHCLLAMSDVSMLTLQISDTQAGSPLDLLGIIGK